MVELMQQWTRIKEAEAESDLSLALVVDAELFRLDAVRFRWLDAADGRIKRAAPGSPGGRAPPPCPGCLGAGAPQSHDKSLTLKRGMVMNHENQMGASR